MIILCRRMEKKDTIERTGRRKKKSRLYFCAGKGKRSNLKKWKVKEEKMMIIQRSQG